MKNLIITSLFLLVALVGCQYEKPPVDPAQLISIVNETEIDFCNVMCIIENESYGTLEPHFIQGEKGGYLGLTIANGQGYSASIILENQEEEIIVDTTFVMEPYADTSAGRTVFCTMQTDSTFVITSKFTYAD